MQPDQHGTTANYRAGCRCDHCRAANTRYDQYRRLDLIRGVQRRVPSTGTRRRVQALATMGWSLKDIAHGCGWQSEQAVHRSINRPNVNADTADKIAAFYDEHRDTDGPSQKARTRARGRGWPTPDRWFDIDNDPAPDPGYSATAAAADLDEVVVERVLAGDVRLAATATRAEREQIVFRWRDSGRPLNELERLTGWQPRRYLRKDVA